MFSKKVLFFWVLLAIFIAVNRQIVAAAEPLVEPEMVQVYIQSVADEYNRVYKEASELIKQLNIQSIRKDQLINEYERSRQNFGIYKNLDDNNPGKLSYMSQELKIINSIYEDLKKLKQIQEVPYGPQTQRKPGLPSELLRPTDVTSTQLLAILAQDLKKYVDNPQGTNLNWCDCANAPMDQRLKLAARIALDAKNYFIKNEELNITSFATGGFINGAAQLLQEFTIIDALMRVWPKDKQITINLALIGPELNQAQSQILSKELRDLNERIIQNKNFVLNISTYGSHRAYIEAVQKFPHLKSDILVSVDYKGISFENIKPGAANCVDIEALFLGNWLPIVYLVFVDPVAFGLREARTDLFLLYYHPTELLKLKGGQSWIDDFRQKIRNFVTENAQKFLQRQPGLRLDLLAKTMKDKMGVLYDAKEYRVSECMLFDLAFKELIAHTLEPNGLIYSLQKEILLPQAYRDIMQDPNPHFSGEDKYFLLQIK